MARSAAATKSCVAYERYVGLGILGRNLQMFGQVALGPGRRRLSGQPNQERKQASRLGLFQAAVCLERRKRKRPRRENSGSRPLIRWGPARSQAFGGAPSVKTRISIVNAMSSIVGPVTTEHEAFPTYTS